MVSASGFSPGLFQDAAQPAHSRDACISRLIHDGILQNKTSLSMNICRNAYFISAQRLAANTRKDANKSMFHFAYLDYLAVNKSEPDRRKFLTTDGTGWERIFLTPALGGAVAPFFKKRHQPGTPAKFAEL